MHRRRWSHLPRTARAVALGTAFVVALAGVVAFTADGADSDTTRPTAPGALLEGAPTADASTAPAAPADPAFTDPCASTTRRTVVVDLSDQHLWLCESGRASFASAVTTGADASPTPVGRWRIDAKETHRWLSGTGYSRQVDYWMPYVGGIGFHDAAWQGVPFGSDAFHTGGSHGCVHVPHAAMKRLYHWAHAGTRVRVVA